MKPLLIYYIPSNVTESEMTRADSQITYHTDVVFSVFKSDAGPGSPFLRTNSYSDTIRNGMIFPIVHG